jgi:hypothetical protein
MFSAMLREALIRAHPERAGDFRWRGDGVSRIEGLSDAVFGFAITLLVVSLEVPRTFDALVVMLAGFPAFAAMFALLVLIWAAQYRFFRHYGLEDGTTIVLNVLLLFVVVFFIYPLKFLFQTFIGLWMGLIGAVAGSPVLSAQGRQAFASLRPTQWPALMGVFAAGYVAVFGILWLLHRHALRQADALALDAVERLHTHSAIREHREHVLVGLASIAVTVVLTYGVHLRPGLAAMLGGFAYFVEWPANHVRIRAFDRARRALAAGSPTGPGIPSVPSPALVQP